MRGGKREKLIFKKPIQNLMQLPKSSFCWEEMVLGTVL